MRASIVATLIVPPLLWGSNAVVGRLAAGLIPPITLNTLRWTVALLILLPLFLRIATPAHRSIIRRHARTLLLGAFCGITCYNGLQYLALTTSSAINVSLIGAATPAFILLVGRFVFGEPISRIAALGAFISTLGVIWIMIGGQLQNLFNVRFAAGDLFMLAGTVVWSVYTWMLRRDRSGLAPIALLTVQIFAGVLLSLPFLLIQNALGIYAPVTWSTKEILIVLYVGVFPSLVAFFCWQRAVATTSAQLPVFFMNLTPIFTVVLSVFALGETPRLFHYIGLVLILSGIACAHAGTVQKK